MGGDPWSPPFSRREEGGGRPVPMGTTGDGKGDVRRGGDVLKSSTAVGLHTNGVGSDILYTSGDCMDESAEGIDVDHVELPGADVMAVDGNRHVGDGQSSGAEDLEREMQRRSDCVMEGVRTDDRNGKGPMIGEGEAAQSFTFGLEAAVTKNNGKVNNITRRTLLLNQKGNTRVSNPKALQTNTKVNETLPSNRDDDQAKKAWTKPKLCRLPAMETTTGVAIRDGRVQLDAEEVYATSKRFEAALVGRLFGRRLSFEILNKELHRRWDGFGSFKVVTLSGDCFICFFDAIEGREAVILGGPWVIAGQVIGVDYWSPGFSPKSKAGFITHVWVRFPRLPLYCWGAKNIVRITGLLGQPTYMDNATEKMDRGHYARVCIRIDLSLPLQAGMWIDGPHGSFYQAVEYEGLPVFCFSCGLVGHKSGGCGSNINLAAKENDNSGKVSTPLVAAKVSPVVDANVENNRKMCGEVNGAREACLNGEPRLGEEAGEPDMQGGLGPWMMVTRRKKQPWKGNNRRKLDGVPNSDRGGRWNPRNNGEQWAPVGQRHGRAASSMQNAAGESHKPK